MANTNIAFGATNLAKTGAITADNQVATMPATNLAGDQGGASMSWRSTSNGLAFIYLTLPSATTIQAVSLHRTNFSNSQLWWFEIYSGGANGTRVGNLGGPGQDQPANPVNGQIVSILPNPVVGNYVRIRLNDPAGNPDGYLSAGMLFVGPIWQPKRNFDYSSTYGRSAIVDETKSINGMEFPQYRNQQRVLKISHQSLGYEETPALDSIFAVAMTGTNILVVPDLTPANINNRTVFGRMVPDSITNPFGGANRSGASFTITERL